MLLKNIFNDALRIDLLIPSEFRKYSQNPEHLIDLIKGNEDKKIIIVDEIQKVPELLSVIHHQIEEHEDQKTFIFSRFLEAMSFSHGELLNISF